MIKLCIIGAGSSVFTKRIITDLLLMEEFKSIYIALMDIDPERLRVSKLIVGAVSREIGANPKIVTYENYQDALIDSDFVITSIQVGGYDPVNEWTLQLLRIRHLGNAEQRLQALFALLVNRLGRRCGDWCQLPFRLTHERIGELIGSTRVTSTRLISRLRTADLLKAPPGDPTLSLSPDFIESSPLTA